MTNAIRYGSGPVQLRLILEDALICEVSDCSDTYPRLRRAYDDDEGGRGLFLVAQLSQRWGTRPTGRHGGLPPGALSQRLPDQWEKISRTSRRA